MFHRIASVDLLERYLFFLFESLIDRDRHCRHLICRPQGGKL